LSVGCASGDPAKTSVIVVTHESAPSIAECLRSIADNPSRGCQEIVVVDNCSTDKTRDIVLRALPSARLVSPGRRQGFAANCNLGASVSTGSAYLFLNPDTRVAPGAIDALVDTVMDPTIAIAGPRMIYPDGTPQSSARRFPTPFTTIVRRTPLRWVMRNTRLERRHLMLDAASEVPPAGVNDVDWVLGAAMAMRSEVFWSLGGMDCGYRLYCEDIDICWRAWKAKRRVVQVPAAVVEHDLCELTRRRFLTRATIWHVRSMARFVLRHGLRPLEATTV
jgi:N-acetylglucosaminyl-diphospho-decaprenol L-rhamnosyltransferase